MTTLAAPSITGATATAATTARIVYFSSVTNNTHRFVEKVGLPAQRIPLRRGDEHLRVHEPFVLVVPTYGGGNGKGAVPKQVIHFLNDPDNRDHIRGVISAGNTNFGAGFCLAGKIIAAKCGIPHMYRFELMGTNEDVISVRDGLEQFFGRHTH